MLVRLRKYFPAELRADFQRFYGLNLGDMGCAFTVRHAADLAACLPPDGAVAKAINPDWRWGLQEHLLATIADTLRWLQWSKTADGAKNRKRPKPIPLPGVDQGKGRMKDAVSVDVDELKRLLALPRVA